jgi:hypothetical protein
MPKFNHVILGILLLCGMFVFPAKSHAADESKAVNSCVFCHSRLPGTSFVGAKSHSWTGSTHQAHGITCDKCHGGDPLASEQKEAHMGMLSSSNPKSSVYFKNIPSTCGKCHGAEFYKFTQSRHYNILESSGKGPECATCHGSMVTRILTPDTISAVCEQCHNSRMGIFPYVPQKAKAVLLLLKESSDLLDAKKKLHSSDAKQAQALRDAQSSLYSARLDWHKFDLDAITADLQGLYDSLKKIPKTSL